MYNLTRKTWGDPANLIDKWIQFSDVLVLFFNNGLKGFTTGNFLDDNVVLYPVTIIDDSHQNHGLQYFGNKIILNIALNGILRRIRFLFKPFYIVFRTPNPKLYASIRKRIPIKPSVNGPKPTDEEKYIAKRVAEKFSPDRHFDEGNFIIKNALSDTPGLVYDLANIPWSNDSAVDNLFNTKMKLKEQEGNEMVVVGKLPKYLIFGLCCNIRNYA